MLELFNIILRRKRRAVGIDCGIHRVTDATFTFRMGAGVAGDVTRWPPTIEPAMLDSAAAPQFYGCPGVITPSKNAFRALTGTDTALTDVYGWVVRPYPYQQRSGGMAAAFGGAVPPVTQPADILRRGYFLAQLSGTPGTIHKGDPVFIWVAATAAPHVQGGVETAANAGNTAALSSGKTSFNGPPDASGLVEIAYNI